MLPPFVGLKCATCQEMINSYNEGSFCEECGNPRHDTCQRAEDAVSQDGKCGACGGDPSSDIAVEVRKERQQVYVRLQRAQAEVQQQPQFTDASTPAATSESSTAAYFKYVNVLVWTLRVGAAICLFAMFYSMSAISSGADKTPVQSPTPGESKAAETASHDVSGAIFMALVYGLVATAAVLALAEILNMVLMMAQSAAALENEALDEETGAEDSSDAPASDGKPADQDQPQDSRSADASHAS
jgi:hypothetical protein